MDKKSLGLLTLIVLIGLFLRFFDLTVTPPSLNWDEISHGYNSYSILKTGMDQWGQKLPLINFRAYGDYPTTLNLYLTIPFILALGLTEFSIRLPHAILGVLTIFSTFFLTFGITKKKSLSLLTSFLVATGPWYVFSSRFVVQSNLSVFLLITSAAFFANRGKNKTFLAVSGILLFLTLISYHTTRIFSPLFLLGTLLIYRNELKNRFILLFVVLFMAISAYILFNREARARGNLLFLVNQAGVNKIETQRNATKLPKEVAKYLYNRPIYFATNFTKNYLSYFSPRFLFLNGGTQYQFSIPNRGLLYWVCLPFFYIGIYLLLKKSVKEKDYRFLLIWLILSPIPASLTNESYTVIRDTTLLPIPEILTSLGFYWFTSKFIKKYAKASLIVLILTVFLMLENYIADYFLKYRTNYSWSWQYGYKEISEYVSTNYSKYDKIVITKKYGEPHEFLLFNLKYDPNKYINDPEKIAYFSDNWWWVDHFDKFWFVNDWQIKLNPLDISSIQQHFITNQGLKIDCASQKCLLITSPRNVPPGWIKKETINFLDGNPAFEIYEN